MEVEDTALVLFYGNDSAELRDINGRNISKEQKIDFAEKLYLKF